MTNTTLGEAAPTASLRDATGVARLNMCIRCRLGGAERNPTDYQDVGFGKASTQPTS